MKKYKKYIICILISLAIELFVFNLSFFVNINNKNVDISEMGGDCFSPNADSAYAIVEDLDMKCSTVYVDVESMKEDGEISPVDVRIKISDEGNKLSYDLPTYRIYPGINREKYITIHPYGNIHSIVITIAPQYDCNLKLNGVVLDAKTPFSFSPIRFLTILFVLLLGCVLWPNSKLWEKKWTTSEKIISLLIVVSINIAVFFVLVRCGKAFLHPIWNYHAQYQNLARAILNGKLTIDEGYEVFLEQLKTLENPYDTAFRFSVIPNSMEFWDMAYYKGHFYVYFGVIPVLIYYIPFRLITHRDLPTWAAVFASASLCVPGVFYLFYVIKKKFFKDLPYLWYLVLSTILANSMNLMLSMLRADFYYLPIITALGFSLWGIALILSVLYDEGKISFLKIIKLVLGSFAIALTSGCRPQFLISIFVVMAMCIPLVVPFNKEKTVKLIKILPCVVIPLIIVAIGMMIYNYIRFESPFDFGANYNMTTNDMVHRGFNLSRIKEGLYLYFVQPVNHSIIFPFAQPTLQYSEYIGNRVSDWMFGGVFMIYPIFLLIPLIGVIRKELRIKKLLIPSVACLVFCVVVVIADSEMAGFINRYLVDFLWLLVIPTFIILCQLMESSKGKSINVYLIVAVLMLGLFGLTYEFCVAIKQSGMLDDNPAVYYTLRSLMALK